MARFRVDQSDAGRLDTRSGQGSLVEGYLMPGRDRVPALRAPEIDPSGIPVLAFDFDSARLQIFPINTLAGSDGYLSPKHAQIRSLTVEVTGLEGYYDDSNLESLLAEDES